MKNILFDLLAFGAIISSILVITSKNPVIAVIFLISVFVNTAGYLILLGVGFVGISYIIVYVGAIAVLFLFVIMMINIKLTDILETGSQYTKNLPLALTIGLLFIYEIFSIVPSTYNNISVLSTLIESLTYFNLLLNYDLSLLITVFNALISNVADTKFISFLQVEALGHGLYTYGAILLIITSIILLLSMVAPIFISTPFLQKNKINN
jgi:NADH-ubiquinone oxidoreductase chain 6